MVKVSARSRVVKILYIIARLKTVLLVTAGSMLTQSQKIVFLALRIALFAKLIMEF
jgi:hypothetical protein